MSMATIKLVAVEDMVMVDEKNLILNSFALPTLEIKNMTA
jgi:hypothetical protein